MMCLSTGLPRVSDVGNPGASFSMQRCGWSCHLPFLGNTRKQKRRACCTFLRQDSHTSNIGTREGRPLHVLGLPRLHLKVAVLGAED